MALALAALPACKGGGSSSGGSASGGSASGGSASGGASDRGTASGSGSATANDAGAASASVDAAPLPDATATFVDRPGPISVGVESKTWRGGLSITGTTLRIGVDGAPGTVVSFPGSKVAVGGTAELDALDLLARVPVRTIAGSQVEARLPIDIANEAGTASGHGDELRLDLGSFHDAMLAAAITRGIAMPGDKGAKYPRDLLARCMRSTDGTLIFSGYVGAEEAEVGNVDLVSVEGQRPPRKGSPCHYVDDHGTRVDKERLIFDTEVKVHDRRTGKVVASTVIAAKAAPCPAEIDADQNISVGDASAIVDRFLQGLVRPHPGEQDNALPPLAPLGGAAAVDPEAWPPERPSKLVPIATRAGMREAQSFIRFDGYDQVSGDVGDSSAYVTELVAPAAPGAFFVDKDYAMVAITHDDNDPTRAQKVIDAVRATLHGEPDPAAIVAALRSFGYPLKERVSLDAMLNIPTVQLGEFAPGGDLMFAVIWLTPPPDWPGSHAKFACRTTRTRALCVAMDEHPEKLLAKLK